MACAALETPVSPAPMTAILPYTFCGNLGDGGGSCSTAQELAMCNDHDSILHDDAPA